MITELEDKYLVLEWVDIEKYLKPKDLKQPLQELAAIIALSRKIDGKNFENKYLVLILDDEIDIDFLQENLIDECADLDKIKVRDIAVGLVNAILKSKGEQK